MGAGNPKHHKTTTMTENGWCYQDGSLPSDLDPSDLTWENVFALMGPLSEEERAIADR